MHAWFRVSRGLTLGVRAAILDGEGRVLLIRHTYLPGWHMPGGGVETGETTGEALSREVREEAGLEIAGPPALHGIFLNRHVSRRDHVLVYVVRAFRGHGPRRPDLEIAEVGWFLLSELPEGTTAGTRARLYEIVNGLPPAPLWAGGRD